MKIQPQFNDAVIAVTYQCNLRCQMCNIWKMTDHRYLLISAYTKLPDTLTDINITGGEPFLRPDLIELTAVIAKTCPRAKIIFSSNGFAADLIIERVKAILALTKNIGVAISIDGIGRIHDQIRGMAGAFDNAVATIKKLKELGLSKFDLKIAFTLNNDNTDQLKKIYQLSQELGVDFTLATVHNSDHYFSIQSNQLTKLDEIMAVLEWLVNQELKQLRPKKWLRAYFTYGLWHFIKYHQRILPDYSGHEAFFMDPSGNIYPSNTSSQGLGQLENIDTITVDDNITEPVSWMICTVRSAVKKHPFKVMGWILKNKLTGHVCLK
jgi:MoaA/NifB/PqqE/SkfB family radical SAM enzyme